MTVTLGDHPDKTRKVGVDNTLEKRVVCSTQVHQVLCVTHTVVVVSLGHFLGVLVAAVHLFVEVSESLHGRGRHSYPRQCTNVASHMSFGTVDSPFSGCVTSVQSESFRVTTWASSEGKNRHSGFRH